MTFVWPHHPNWASAFRHQIAFRTSTWRAQDGSQSRTATRFEPRETFSYQAAALTPDDFEAVRRDMVLRQRQEIVMPRWGRAANLAAAVPAGATEIPVSIVHGWMRPGAELALVSGAAPSHLTGLAEILSVSGATITLTAALPAPHPAGAVVAEAFRGQLAASARFDLPAAQMGVLAVRFDVTPGAAAAAAAGTPGETLGGLEVLTEPPNWGRGVDEDFRVRRETVDPGYGVPANLHPEDTSEVLVRSRLLRTTPAGAVGVEQFFRRHLGAHTAFYAPSEVADFRAASAAQGGLDTLTVAGTAAADLFGGDMHRAISLHTADGSRVVRRVSGAAVSGGNTVVTVTEPWAETLPPSAIRRVGALHRAYFGTDTLTIDWLNQSTAQIDLRVERVKDVWA